MPTIGTVSRPAYVYDQETDTWVPVGVGPHTHENFIQSTVIDAKGDLLVGLSPDTVDRLGIGGNGTFLVADSTQTLGMAWRNIITPATAATVPLILRGAVSQTANLLDIQNSASGSLFTVNSSGSLVMNSATQFFPQVNMFSTSADAFAPYFIFNKNRNSATVNNNDYVGTFQYKAYDGAAYRVNASIEVNVDGAPGSDIMPGRISFWTRPSTAGAALAERMRIDRNGLIYLDSFRATLYGTYIIPDTGNSGPTWTRLGTWTAPQNGSTLRLTLIMHTGFNAIYAQNATTDIHFKTSNGGSADINGFAADGFYVNTGYGLAMNGVKVVANAAGTAATTYTFFINTSSYTNQSVYTVQASLDSSWVHNPQAVNSDPGVASSTIGVLANATGAYAGINSQAGTSYTVLMSDVGRLLELTSSSATTITIPTNATTQFPLGAQIPIMQAGTGQVTVVGAGGVTVNATPGARLRAQWSSATLIKRGENAWVVVGDLVP